MVVRAGSDQPGVGTEFSRSYKVVMSGDAENEFAILKRSNF